MSGAFTPGPAGGQGPLNFSGAPVGLAYDAIDALPPAAAERLRQLRQRAKDAHAIVPPFEQVREASMARVEAENALNRLTSHQQYGGFNLPAEHRSVIEATRTLEKATADFNRLTELQRVRSSDWQASTAALSAVEGWLRDARPSGEILEDWDGPDVKLVKGETVIAGIERLRRRVRELRADLHRIQSAPFPSSHAKQRMRAQIEAMAMQGAPSVSLLVESDGDIIWPTVRQQSEVHGEQRALAFAQVPDTLALMCWLHRDALIKKLDAEIASEADDPAALSHEERREREAEVMGDLLACERDECSLTWQAMEQSQPVEFRGDISPLAVLGIALRTVPRADAPPSSRDHSFEVFTPGER